MKSLLLVLITACTLHSAAVLAAAQYGEKQPEDAALSEASFTLGPYHIDRLYPSMKGPSGYRKITLGAEAETGTVWVKALHMDITNAQGGREPADFMCHAWLMLNKPGDDPRTEIPMNRIKTGGRNYNIESTTNLTLSNPGYERKMPQGFALPVERQSMNAAIMAMALNDQANIDKRLSYTLTVQYLDDAAAKKYNIRPLKMFSVFIPTVDATPDYKGPTEALCLSHPENQVDTMQSTNNAVFYVPTGRHEFRTTLEKAEIFKTGGTLHFMSIHIHRYGESMAWSIRPAAKSSGAAKSKGLAHLTIWMMPGSPTVKA